MSRQDSTRRAALALGLLACLSATSGAAAAMQDQARAARRARSYLSVEKLLADMTGAAWDKRDLEAGEPALAAGTLVRCGAGDLAATLEACLGDRKRERNLRAGYERTLVAFARAAQEAGDAQREALLPYLSHADVSARHLALAGLAAAEKPSAELRAAVVDALGDRKEAVRLAAARCCELAGAKVAPIRAEIAEAYGKEKSEGVVERLKEALDELMGR